MKTTATKKVFQSVQATTTPPPNYRHQDIFDLSKSRKAVVGIAPLVLLTLAGLLLVAIVPVVVVPILIFFVAFNAAGDLLTVARLLSYSPDTLMQDNSSGVIIYGPV